MAAVWCARLPVQSPVAAAQASAHSVECNAAAQLGGVGARRRGSAGRAGRLSCASSLGGASLGLELGLRSRRRSFGVVSTRCESSSEEGAPEKVQCWPSLLQFNGELNTRV